MMLVGPEPGLPCGETHPSPTDRPIESELLTEPEALGQFDAWELEERLRHVKRLLSGAGNTAPRTVLTGFRIDAAQTHNPRQPAPRAVTSPTVASHNQHAGSWGSFFSWSAIMLGLAATTCGGILAVWSYLAPSRHDLREIGVPTLFGGLVVLVIGLLLQLRLAWRSARSFETAAPSAAELRSAAVRVDSTPSDVR